MKKITKSTVESFIKKNINNLYINITSSFDGMTDGCESRNEGFKKATRTNAYSSNTLGISGAWFVNGSRDYFTSFEDDKYKGFGVYNSCGSFSLGIQK